VLRRLLRQKATEDIPMPTTSMERTQPIQSETISFHRASITSCASAVHENAAALDLLTLLDYEKTLLPQAHQPLEETIAPGVAIEMHLWFFCPTDGY